MINEPTEDIPPTQRDSPTDGPTPPHEKLSYEENMV